MLSRSIFPTARTIFPTSILCPGVVTRYMGGGKRYSKHNPKIHIKQRHRLILKYCEDIFKNRSRWVRMESLMYSDTFRGWTKVKTFLGAFESEKGRGEYEIQRKTEQKKGTCKACKPTSSKGSKDWWSDGDVVYYVRRRITEGTTNKRTSFYEEGRLKAKLRRKHKKEKAELRSKHAEKETGK